MTSENPDEASIFNAARKIDSKEDRAAYLDEACQGVAELRQRVEELLQAYWEESQFLEQAAIEQATIIGQGDGDIAASMEAGLAPAFGEEAAVVIGDATHSVLRSLSNSLNEAPSVSLRESEVEGDDPIARPNSPEMPKPDSDSRYQLQGEIARGGMGAIIKGRDTDLGRDLAIKVLLDSHKDSPEVIQRFVEEAQIGGQLQHPGIAPVYELGQFEDRRPFFSMKLVKGQTLSKLLADREDAGEDRARFLGIFEQVCQTMAYAHSRGVIHRDLKPANIMVGAFGEVQVMDWGLAKVLPAGGIEDEKNAQTKHKDISIIQTMRSLGSNTPGTIGPVGSPTQMGSVMGTPAYMPPEQALGEIDQMDERADVFGLGAILCEILTGKPPYVGDDTASIYRMASHGKLDDALQRLDDCAADADLIALTKACLALEPADRPRDAGELAERVTGYLESVETKLRETELQRAAESARAIEARKRMRVTLALAATVLLMLSLLGGGWVWREREAVRHREMVNGVLHDAQVHQSLADTADLTDQLTELDKAISYAQQAVTLTEHEAVESSLKESANQLLAELQSKLTVVQTATEQASRDRQFQARLELIRLSQADNKIQEVAIDESKADRFPSFSDESAEQSFPLFNISTSLARYYEAFRDAGLDLREDLSESEIAEAVQFVQSSAIRESLIAALDNWARSIPHPVADNDPSSLTRETLLAIADEADDSQWRRSVRNALNTGDSVKLKELAAMDKARFQSPVLIAWLGAALRESDEVASSVDLLEQAQRNDPDDFWLNYELGKSYSSQGKHLEGLGFARTAVGIRPDSLGAMIALARISTNASRYDEAAAIYQEVITRKPDVVEAHTGLATVYSSEGHWTKAADAYREALELEPNNVEIRSSLGLALVFAGQVSEGQAECRTAVDLDPKNVMAHFNLAQALDDKSITGVENAAEEYQKVLELDPQHAWAHFRLAQIEAWYLEKNLVSAEMHLRTAVQLNPQIPDFHAILAHVLTGQGKVDEAITVATKAIEQTPTNAHLYTELSFALRHTENKDSLGDAVAAGRIAVMLNPRDHYAHTSLGAALRGQALQGQARTEKLNLEEAISEHRQAVAINPTSHARMLLGTTLIVDKQFAEGALVLAQTYDPDDANLGQTLHIQRQMQTALKRLCEQGEKKLFEQGETEQILAALNTILDRHGTSEEALALVVSVRQECDLGDDVTAYLEMLKDAPESAVVHAALAEAYHRQGLPEEAMKACRKAIELAPISRSPYDQRVTHAKTAGQSNDDSERSLRDQLTTGAAGLLADLLVEQWSVQKWPQLSVRLGQQNESNGIQLVEGIGDGRTEPVIKAGQECRTLARYAYFTIDEKQKPAASIDALVGVEYWDDGSGGFGLEYDAIGHPYRRCSEKFDFGGSQTWKTAKFCVTNARFANSENGQSDFRLYARGEGLHVRQITLQRVQPALETSDPWARLAAAYHLTGDDEALGELRQNHPHAEVGIGDLYLASRNWERAIEVYERLIEDEIAGDTPRKNLSKANNGWAWELVTSRDRDGRFRNLEKGLNLAKGACDFDPDNGVYQTTLGVAYYRNSEWKNARRSLKKSIDLGVEDPRNWLFLAMVCQQLDESTEARTWYDKADSRRGRKRQDAELETFYGEAERLFANFKLAAQIAESPENPALRFQLGNSLAFEGRWDEAAAAYRQAVDLHKVADTQPSADEWNAWLTLLAKTGDTKRYHAACSDVLAILADTRRPKQAEQAAKSCLMIAPSSDNLPRIVALSERAVNLQPTRPRISYAECVRGLAAYRNGKFQDAIDWSQRCLSHPESASAGFRTAQAYLVIAMANTRLDQVDQADEALKKANSILDRQDAMHRRTGTYDEWKDWLIADSLRREADTLLKIK